MPRIPDPLPIEPDLLYTSLNLSMDQVFTIDDREEWELQLRRPRAAQQSALGCGRH